MKITIVDWLGGSVLKGTPYTHGQSMYGTKEAALVIARELFDFGRNVMLVHSGEDGIDICVDTRRFTQR